MVIYKTVFNGFIRNHIIAAMFEFCMLNNFFIFVKMEEPVFEPFDSM